MKKSTEKDWKERVNAIESIEAFIKENSNTLTNMNIGEFVEFFKPRVNDSNKTVAKAYVCMK